MPVLGLGTWQMGGRYERDPNNNDGADIKAIKTAIELGITHIDTAEVYADGWAEKLAAEAIKGYDRKNLFLVSKVSGDHLQYDEVMKACGESLKRLQTSYLDLYLIHWFNSRVPLQETMRALDELIEQGMVKRIGVSNFTPEHLAQAQRYTKNKIVCDQVHYNLIFREPERKGLLKYCQENDVFLSAWRPVEKGLLAKGGTPILDELCKKYKKTPAQIAINWLISQQNVVTIAKMSRVEHLKENLGGVGWQMEQDDIERLRNEFPHQQSTSNAVPLG
ncbi:MAG: aldo/keto reductase [Candidatus Portnoybacteria bacterium]|nr:aldo/keto reductase [Candidatus Portnoybacteria bacterium]